MTAIILDTETTGFDAPDVIELAWVWALDSVPDPPMQQPALSISLGAHYVLRWKPRKAIALGAMAAHHIIASDLEKCPEWPGAWQLPEGTEYVIGHNIDYDWQAIGSPAVKRICTLALARKLWPALDSHSLTAMIYHLLSHPEARELVRGAHGALIDAGLCYRLLVAELAMMPAIASWERLWAASEKARIPTVFTFGKYGPAGGRPGSSIEEVRRMDPGYITWCLTKCDQCKDEYWQRALRGEAR